MNDTCTFILENEEWIMERLLKYANQTNYTKYTSTLLEAWRLSINMLSKTLAEAITARPEIPELGPDEDYTRDPIAAFGILEARRHRERGITLDMFLGLMKYYRQSYRDLVRESSLPAEKIIYGELYIERFFDRVELGFIKEWSSISEIDRISALEATNRRMTNEKNKYLTLFESQVDPVLLLNEKNEIENINLAAARLVSEEHVPGATYYRHLPVKEKFPWVSDEVEGFLKSEKTEVIFEREVTTMDGIKIFQIKLKKMLDVSKKFSGIVVIMNDITAKIDFQKNLEQAMTAAENANKAKSEFLAHMSHELRTPLNGILGYTQILKKDPALSDSQLTGIEIIEKSGTHLLTLINDVLDLAKIEANKIELNSTPFHLSPFLKNIIDMIRIKAWEKNLGFGYHKESTLPEYVVGDEKRIGQVLINILVNAVKFTDTGTVKLSVSYIKGKVFFKIIDTGIGIEQEQLQDIFSPFKQLTQRDGTGLGLSICKKLVELMNGTIEVESEHLKGTVFTVSFELPESDKKNHKKSNSSYKGTVRGYEGKRVKIVIIDDKEINRLVLLDYLAPLDFEITQASNGEEGFELALLEKPDLIITDLVMPGMDGFELTRKVRETDSLKGVIIFAASASTFEADKDKSFITGADEFIAKPINFDELIKKMEKHLAIKWLYSSESEIPGLIKEQEIKKQYAPILPPEEQIKKLYEYAREGDLDGIKEEILEIKKSFPESKSFYTDLGILAEEFKIGEICSYLEELLGG